MPAKETKQSLTLLIFTINHLKVSKYTFRKRVDRTRVMILVVIAVGLWVQEKMEYHRTEEICGELPRGGYYPPSSVN